MKKILSLKFSTILIFEYLSMLKIKSKTKVEFALEDIKNRYKEGKIIICGSLYLAGEILKKNGTKIT